MILELRVFGGGDIVKWWYLDKMEWWDEKIGRVLWDGLVLKDLSWYFWKLRKELEVEVCVYNFNVLEKRGGMEKSFLGLLVWYM